MELPTCPSCGQSVLDDDAADCPFCGESMSAKRSSRPKPVAEKAAQRSPSAPSKAAKKAEDKPSDDDPFAVQAAPEAVKAVQASPKPRKGRLHKVICPMCDTAGFVPKGAIGRHARCANKECLVPVFEIPDPDAPEEAPAPRATEAEAETGSAARKPAGSMTPLLAGGGVLLLLGIGLVWYLNQPPDRSDLDMPSGYVPPEDAIDPDAENQNSDNGDVAVVAQFDPRAASEELVRQMVDASRVSSQNRDKPFCRSLTADTFFRLGNSAAAEAELSQLAGISQRAVWYGIEPRLEAWWQSSESGSPDTEMLTAAERLFSEIPPGTGRQSLDAATAAAAALAATSRSAEGVQLLNRHRGDFTDVKQLEMARLSALISGMRALENAGADSLQSYPRLPLDSPLVTAVAVRLAARGKWAVATEWATSAGNTNVAGEALTVIARFAKQLNATPEDVSLIRKAATTLPTTESVRVAAALVQSNADLAAVRTTLETIPAATPVALPELSEYLNYIGPQDAALHRRAMLAAGEYASAAARIGNSEEAQYALTQLARHLHAMTPPVVELRLQLGFVVARDSQARKEIAAELRIPESDSQTIQRRFENVRRELGSVSQDAETNRQTMGAILEDVVSSGGAAAVEAFAAEEEINKVLTMDPMCDLIRIPAVLQGADIPSLQNVPRSRRVFPTNRVRIGQEILLGSQLLAAAQSISNGEVATGLDTLRNLNEVPSIATGLLLRATARAANQHPMNRVLNGVATVKDRQWQELALDYLATRLVRDGKAESVIQWTKSATLPPATRVSAIHGTVRGLLMLPPESADDTERDANESVTSA